MAAKDSPDQRYDRIRPSNPTLSTNDVVMEAAALPFRRQNLVDVPCEITTASRSCDAVLRRAATVVIQTARPIDPQRPCTHRRSQMTA
jgi:hypothetical protein